MIAAVCGLHGGAGTTTVASLLAAAGAAHRPGRVLLADTSPSAGDLALAHLTQSSYSLTDLAHLHPARQSPASAPWSDLPDGVRLLAREPGRRRAATHSAIADVLRDAGVTHDLVVVDAGPVTSDHCRGALSIADTVYWTLDAATTLTRLAHLLSSDLIVPAQRARWVLALSATAGGALPATTREVAELVPSASGLVCLPAIRGLGRGAASALAGEQLLSALT